MISPHILPNKYKSSRNKLLENVDVVILWLLEPSALLAWAVSVGVSVGVSSDSLEQGRVIMGTIITFLFAHHIAQHCTAVAVSLSSV